MTLCLGLGNLQKLSSTDSLKLVQSAIELGIRRFDSSVNYLNNSDVLDIFFREPSNSKVIIKVGNSTQFELRSLRADLKSVQRVDRSNIETIMLNSTPVNQIYGKTLDYLQDYCNDL